MQDLYKDIEKSVEIIDNDCFYRYGKHSPLCLFSVENLQAKNNISPFKDKNILTPAGSGDQYLNAKYYGAKHITVYDINILSKYYTNLKIAAIKGLSYEEFLLFLVPNLPSVKSELFLSHKLLKKVDPFLSLEEKIYWKEILLFSKTKGFNKFISNDKEVYNFENIKNNCEFYSSSSSFNLLKKELLKDSCHDFILGDIRTIAIKDQFDIVDLSNIISGIILESYYDDRLDYTWEQLNYIYVEFIKRNIIPITEYGGDIFVDYYTDIKNHVNENLLLKNEEFTYHEINSKKQNKTDLILKLKKS